MHDLENSRFYGENGWIYLSKAQNIILDVLIRNKDCWVSYKKLIKAVYGLNDDKYLKMNIETHIYRLKLRLKDEVKIVNRKNLGYMLEGSTNE